MWELPNYSLLVITTVSMLRKILSFMTTQLFMKVIEKLGGFCQPTKTGTLQRCFPNLNQIIRKNSIN